MEPAAAREPIPHFRTTVHPPFGIQAPHHIPHHPPDNILRKYQKINVMAAIQAIT